MTFDTYSTYKTVQLQYITVLTLFTMRNLHSKGRLHNNNAITFLYLIKRFGRIKNKVGKYIE